MYILLNWLLGALALWLVARIIPGIQVRSYGTALLATAVLAVVNILVGWPLKLLSLPFIILTLGLFWLILNAFLLKLASLFVPGFTVRGFLPAFLGSIVLTLLRYILSDIVFSPMADYFTDIVRPASPEDLADALRWASARGQTIELGGNFTKRMMGGAAPASNMTISTSALNRVLQYEPRDLTISVEAGMSYGALSQLLATHRQMIPLDPPFADTATVGGVIACNSSGPRRRLYGTARDMVIGMHFATLEGKVVQSGGMVVKNVAGLDMAKLMIGSFGTLAAIAVVNFKVFPQPPCERTFRFEFAGLEEALAARDAILISPLDPAAIDLLNPAAAATVAETEKPVWILAVRAGGNAAAIARYERDLAAMGALPVPSPAEAAFWRVIEQFTPNYLAANPNGAVVRASCTLKELKALMQSIPGPALARAGAGVCHAYFEDAGGAAKFAAGTAREHSETVVEFAPQDRKEEMPLWPAPGQDLEIMRRIKYMFDPQLLLNRGRLYNRI